MKKYEYKIVDIEKKKYSGMLDIEATEVLLTGYGMDGWRVVQPISYDGTVYQFLLEREI